MKIIQKKHLTFILNFVECVARVRGRSFVWIHLSLKLNSCLHVSPSPLGSNVTLVCL